MKEHLLGIAKAAGGYVPDALLIAGAAAVSFGAGQVYAPAGWIVGGIFALVAGWLLARTGDALLPRAD